jgi:O-6-methylguanine DNA methyltransferase
MTDSRSILSIHTSWGIIYVALSGGKVAACDLPVVHHLSTAKPFSVVNIDTAQVAKPDAKAATMAAAFVVAVLSGKSAQPPPVLLPDGTPMQQSVWRELQSIKRGQVITYGELAKRVGKPRAARAVGQACGANPIPLFIPCHRVLAASGGIGGFSGGLAWKEWLLDHEALPVPVVGRKS